MSIYVSCDGKLNPVGSDYIAKIAISKIRRRGDYDLLSYNCHQFVSGCLLGNNEVERDRLWMVKEDAKKAIGASSWRVWDIDQFSEQMKFDALLQSDLNKMLAEFENVEEEFKTNWLS